MLWKSFRHLSPPNSSSFIRTFFFKSNNERPYRIVKTGFVSPQIEVNQIPSDVCLPSYANSGDPDPGPDVPEIKDPDTILKMKKACSLARKILTEAGNKIRVGVTTDELDELVTRLSFVHNAYPSPLNYKKFPKSVCTSVNNCVCHGIPDDQALVDGDIINVDITVFLDGVHGDCSETFLVGNVDEAGQNLVTVARDCLYGGIEVCGPGVPFRAIGQAIETYASSKGFNVIPAFTGHGIGSYFHGPPDIYHIHDYYYPGTMKPGMTFTIEPAIGEGSPQVLVLEDGWTAVSVDNSRSAQFEHTVLITDSGVEILTAK